MKIIRMSNFGNENVSDGLIAEKVQDHYVDFIVEVLNEKYSGYKSPDFFRAVEDDYELYIKP